MFMGEGSKQPEQRLKFLIATDVHLGHAENHKQLGNDSYAAFEQVLEIAKKNQVDFLLLGGDLFDEVNPSQKCLFKCLSLLRDNIFGDKALKIGVKGINPNFSNINLNIELPVFTIHGNHDYPSNDFGKISVCDLLHASNYVNYFGKQINLSQEGTKKIVVKPLVFQKSGLSTHLAIYGLGYIKDLKLHKMLLDKLVIFEQPDKKDQTVCILMIHQNRFKGKKGGVGASYENCVHAEQLPKWMDLVIWCHQHEAISKIQKQSDITIFQPGSTVITSYIQAESYKKQCGLITIEPNKCWKLNLKPLQKSFRPMVTRSYSLQTISQTLQKENDKVDFNDYFQKQIEQILNQLSAESKLNKKPIIRIKVDYSGHNIIRLIKIQEKYRQLVANGNKIFTYTQKRAPKKYLGLEDNDVLDMIKNSKVHRNLIKETQLTQEIMQFFTEQISKSPLFFFEQAYLKDVITELANESRTSLGDIKQMYYTQIERKTSDLKKNISLFNANSNSEYDRIKEKLLSGSNRNQTGQKTQINIPQIRADIGRLKNSYYQKQREIQSFFDKNQQKNSDLGSKKTQQYSQGSLKSSMKQEDRRPKNRESSVSNRSSSSENGIFSKEVPSDEEDCCKKAERSDYRQNDTRLKFEGAEKMAKDRKKGKGKKNVKFNDN